MVNWNAQLRRAAAEGSLDTIKEALANGADVDAPETTGWGEPWTPLMFAAANDYEACVAFLLERGATPTLAAFLLAIGRDSLASVGPLLEHGVPLEGSVSRRLQRDVKWARSAHCPPPDPNNWAWEDTADFLNVLLLAFGSQLYLHILSHPALRERGLLTPCVLDSGLLCASHMGVTDVLEPLLELGADVNAATPYGRTALHLAASAGQWRTVKILIGRGADLNRPAPDGSTPLLIALLRGHRRIAAVLVKGGADLRPKVYGDDAEAIATAQGMDRVLREIQKRKDAVP